MIDLMKSFQTKLIDLSNFNVQYLNQIQPQQFQKLNRESSQQSTNLQELNQESSQSSRQSTNLQQSLDFYSMVIVANYFDNVYDYINLTKTCKKYLDVVDTFRYNPIPILIPANGIIYYQQRQNKHFKLAGKIFKNIDTLHIDCPINVHQLLNICDKYYKIIYWPPIYFSCIFYNLESCNSETRYQFKNVIFKNVSFDGGMTELFENENARGEENSKSEGSRSALPSNPYELINFNNIRCHDNINIVELELIDKNISKKIICPQELRFINKNCFTRCTQLEEIELFENVIDIGIAAFYSCINLREIIIPDSVTKIGKRCFAGCYKLSKVKSLVNCFPTESLIIKVANFLDSLLAILINTGLNLLLKTLNNDNTLILIKIIKITTILLNFNLYLYLTFLIPYNMY